MMRWLSLFPLLIWALSCTSTPQPGSQTFIENGYVIAHDGGGRQSSKMPSIVLEEYTADGKRLRNLPPPAPLFGLGYSTWMEAPLQLGKDTYTAGIPAHPAWDLLHPDLNHGVDRVKRGTKHHLPNRHPLITKAEARLYKSHHFGPWQEIARFRMDTGWGWTKQMIPLQNGRFMGIAVGLFGKERSRSPLAIFRRDERGYLTFERLLSLDSSQELPALFEGEWDSSSCEVLHWRPTQEAFRDCKRAIWTPHGLVLTGGRGALLLDLHDGRVLNQCVLPDGFTAHEAQPTPPGEILLWARQRIPGITDQLERRRPIFLRRYEPGLNQLVFERFQNKLFFKGSWWRQQWMTWNPKTGALILRDFPLQKNSLSLHGPFHVDRMGRPVLLQSH